MTNLRCHVIAELIRPDRCGGINRCQHDRTAKMKSRIPCRSWFSRFTTQRRAGTALLRRAGTARVRGGLGRTQKVKAHGACDGLVRCAAETAPHAPPQMRRARRTVRSPRVLRRTCDTRTWAVERRVNATGDPRPSRPSCRRRRCRGP